MYGAHRDAEDGAKYWRVAHFLFPCWTMPPLNPLEIDFAVRAYVPMDDENTMMVVMMHKDARSADRMNRRDTLSGAHDFQYAPRTTDWFGRWRLTGHRGNDYLIDRERQRTHNYNPISLDTELA